MKALLILILFASYADAQPAKTFSSGHSRRGTPVWNGTDDTTPDGRQAFLVLGHSTARGSGVGPGTTPLPNTVYQVHQTTLIVSQISTTDMDDALGTTDLGTQWPSFGTTYYAKTGKKPMILNWGIPGSTFGDWVTTHYPTVKGYADTFLETQGLTKYKAIFIHLGINDRNLDPATVQTNCTSFFNTLTTDYPDIPIFIAQAAQSIRNSTQLMMIKRMLRDVAEDYPNITIYCDEQSIHANGYFYDALHYNTLGCNEVGKMGARAVADYENYSKWALSIISTHYDDLSTTKKDLIEDFITSIGDDYFDLDELCLWKQSDQRSQRTDYCFYNGVVSYNSTFVEDNFIQFGGLSNYMRSGILPANSNVHATASDNFSMMQIKQFAAGSPAATAALYGASDGTNYHQIFQITASADIEGNLNSIAATKAVNTTTNFEAGHAYGIKIDGGTIQLLKDGSGYGSAVANASPVVPNEEISFGGLLASGTQTNQLPVCTRYFVTGKSSTVNKSALYNALEILCAD